MCVGVCMLCLSNCGFKNLTREEVGNCVVLGETIHLDIVIQDRLLGKAVFKKMLLRILKQICICEFVVQNAFVGSLWKVTEFTKVGFPSGKVSIGGNMLWKYM